MSKKNNKIDKSKIFVRIMAFFLAALMVLSVAATLIYYLV
jgi:YbbR domain-containing protein